MAQKSRLSTIGSSIEEIITNLPNNLSMSFSRDKLNQRQNSLQSNTHCTESNFEINKREKSFTTSNEHATSNVSEVAFVSAIYNTIAIAIFVSCLALCALVYVVLQAFIRSILWALLTSAFLFAFKRYLTDIARTRLIQIDRRGSTLALELLIAPLRLIDSLVNFIWSTFTSHIKNVLLLSLAILFFHIGSSFYDEAFYWLALLCDSLMQFTFLIINYIDLSWQYTATFVIAYMIAIAFYWRDENCALFQVLSIPVWLSLILLFSKLLGSTLRPIFIMVFLVLIVLGIYSYVNEIIVKYRRRLLSSSANALDEDEIHVVEATCEVIDTPKVQDVKPEGETDETSTTNLMSDIKPVAGSLQVTTDALKTEETPKNVDEKNLITSFRKKIHHRSNSAEILGSSRPKNLSFNIMSKSPSSITRIQDDDDDDDIGNSNNNNDIVDDENDDLNSPIVDYESTKQEFDNDTNDEMTLNAESDSSSLSSSSSSSHDHSFLRSTIINLYQTSLYYLSGNSMPEETNAASKNEKASNRSRNISCHTPPGLTTLLRKRERKSSDKYFKALFWLFICVKLRFDMYILIPILVILWKLAKFLSLYLYDHVVNKNELTRHYINSIKKWYDARRAVLAPRPFHLLLKLYRKGDHKLNQSLQKSMHGIVSASLIIGLMLFAFATMVVLAMQVHAESVQLISITSNIFNENLYSKPELREWLPAKERLDMFYESTMNNFYVYGREWLSSRLRTSNSSDYMILEKQILAQWDNLYAYLTNKTASPPSQSPLSSYLSLNMTRMANETEGLLPTKPFAVPLKKIIVSTKSQETVDMNKKRNMSNLWGLYMLNPMAESFNYSEMAMVIKNNLGTLVSILDSVYLIVKGNITLFSTVLLTMISIIYNSGFALMNFIFSMIVYLTALFYLLAMSDSEYKPLQWITEIRIFKGQTSSSTTTTSAHETTSSTLLDRRILLTRAIEESIRSVFFASLKMATFYGIFTWLVHSAFDVNIVYLPSIFAALFGFLPLFGTYWCSLPGILELWLIQHKPFHAILFFVLHIMPTYVVDTAIYSQVKTGHPYLTGLAFAGGVYCLGLEGAIIGPIVLCLLIVIVKMFTSVNQTSSTSGSLGSGYQRSYSTMNSNDVDSRRRLVKTPSIDMETKNA